MYCEEYPAWTRRGPSLSASNSRSVRSGNVASSFPLATASWKCRHGSHQGAPSYTTSFLPSAWAFVDAARTSPGTSPSPAGTMTMCAFERFGADVAAACALDSSAPPPGDILHADTAASVTTRAPASARESVGARRRDASARSNFLLVDALEVVALRGCRPSPTPPP